MVERRARHELGRAQQRLHLVDGFLAAMAHLDAVVQVGSVSWVSVNAVGGFVWGWFMAAPDRWLPVGHGPPGHCGAGRLLWMGRMGLQAQLVPADQRLGHTWAAQSARTKTD